MIFIRDSGSQSEENDAEEFDALIESEPKPEPKPKKTLKKTESRKREANDSDSSASGPSSTSPTKKAKTATKAQLKEKKEEPSSSLNDRDPSPVPSYSVKKSSAAVSGLLDRPTLARPASPSIGIDLVTSSQTLRYIIHNLSPYIVA